MKQPEIIPGHIYFDEKKGAREVLEIKKSATTVVVKYKICAAAKELEYRHKLDPTWKGPVTAEKVSVIGRAEVCTISSFCTWAKTGLPPKEGVARSNRMRSERVDLNTREFTFMEALSKASMTIDLQRFPGIGKSRVADSLIQKGLLCEYAPDGSTKPTDVGQAWVDRYILAKSQEEDNPADADRDYESNDAHPHRPS